MFKIINIRLVIYIKHILCTIKSMEMPENRSVLMYMYSFILLLKNHIRVHLNYSTVKYSTYKKCSLKVFNFQIF